MENNNDFDYKEFFANLSEELSFFQSKEWKATCDNFIKVANAIGNVLIELYESEALQAIGRFAQKVQDFYVAVQKIELPKIELSEDTIKRLEKASYLSFLEKIEWPLYLFIDDELISLLEPFKDDDNIDNEEINALILNYINDDFIGRVSSKWDKMNSLSQQRIAPLSEAIELFKRGYYYGCTSLLTCQLEGIITDSYEFEISSGKEFSLEDFRLSYEYFNDGKSLNGKPKTINEKNKLLAMVSDIESGIFYWVAVIQYLYKIIFTSEESMNQSNHPCRNKIYHGIQLNYGTREHAVKAILVTDMTIKFCEEKYKIIMSNAEQET